MSKQAIVDVIVYCACAAFNLLAVSPSVAKAQQVFLSIGGNVKWASNIGNSNIRNARVQLLNPGDKRVLKWARTKDDASYEIPDVQVGNYQLAACDDQLIYEPDIQSVTVQQNRSFFQFRLTRNDDTNALPVQIKQGQPRFLYLKHIRTGCELAGIPSNSAGIFSVPNTRDSETFYRQFVYCPDDHEESDPTSPYDSCIRRHIPIGLAKSKLIETWGTPFRRQRNNKGEQVLVYNDVKVTLVNDKVSSIRIEIEQQ